MLHWGLGSHPKIATLVRRFTASLDQFRNEQWSNNLFSLNNHFAIWTKPAMLKNISNRISFGNVAFSNGTNKKWTLGIGLTLGQLCKKARLGDDPRRVISELSEIRLVDVVLPTDTGGETQSLRCKTYGTSAHSSRQARPQTAQSNSRRQNGVETKKPKPNVFIVLSQVVGEVGLALCQISAPNLLRSWAQGAQERVELSG